MLALDDASATLERVGGKGSSLVRLAVAGLPMPPGFHITTAAYRHFVARHGLQEQILAAVSTTSPDQPATLEAAAQTIATLFAQHPMPDELAETIRQVYFDSKPALLSALVERMGDQVEQLVLPIVHDPKLSALDKLQRFFATLDHWKLAHKRFVLAYLRIWYGDENAIIRHKLYIARVKRFAPQLEEIIRQEAREAVLTTPYPDQAARVVISLLEDLGYATAELILSGERTPDDLPRLERIVTATADALERVLGAPAGCLQHACEGLSQWLVPTSATMVWYPGSEDDDGLVKEVREEYHSKKRLLDGSLENVLRDMNAL